MCFMVQRFNFKVKEGFKLESWKEGLEDFFVIKKLALPVVVDTHWLHSLQSVGHLAVAFMSSSSTLCVCLHVLL
jgi:hypothetical protein